MSRATLGLIAALALWLAPAANANAYTAVALSQSMAYGYCSDEQSLGSAIDCAMSYCRQAATDPDTCTIGLQAEPRGHYSLAIGGGAWGVASGETSVEADSDALLYCKAANCNIVARWTEGVVRGN
ncbi:MAG: DUF4189 domain-containing protein [Devosia sp.]